MRLFGLENNLVIGCANFEKKKLRFRNVFYHENYGRKKNYLPFNKTFSLWTALKNNIIKQPFAVIDPDMIMVSPLDYSSCSYSQYWSFSEYKNLKKCGYNFDIEESQWKPCGGVYYFNNFDNNLLLDIHNILIKMFDIFYYLMKGAARWQIEMVAFAYVLSKNLESDVRVDLESSLMEDKSSNFIHYCNGCLPYFNKRIHNNLREFSFGESLPFKSILSIPNKNKNIINFKKVTKSFLDNCSNDLRLI
jgi:hypothetical protein